MIYTEDHAALFKDRAGQKWQPSNGFEGELFISMQCVNCAKWQDGTCEIMLRTMCFGVEDDEYPQEWQYGTDGQPKCTAFQSGDDESNLTD